MENGKLDNQLSYSLSTPENQREKTDNLNVGYDSEEGIWELIIKYQGDIIKAADDAGLLDRVGIKTLIGEFAVITIKEEDIESFADIPQVYFMERPTRLFFSLDDAKDASCIYNEPVSDFTTGNDDFSLNKNLTGKGVFVAIIDSGIDYFHPDFRNEDGSSRIFELWDQTTGNVFTRDEINAAIALGRREGERLVNQRDLSGHGTHVAGIACGNGRASGGRYRGVAYESELLVVKLGDSIGSSFPRTTRLLEALDYVVNVAIRENKPIAINLSFGNNYGTHSGDSLVVSYINNICQTWKNNVIIGSGNEAAGKTHTEGILGREDRIVEFSIGDLERTTNLQIWRNYYDEFDIYLEFLDLTQIKLNTNYNFSFDYGNTKILVYNSAGSPVSGRVETFLEFIPKNQGFIDSGLYKLHLKPINIKTGEYNMWFPVTASISEETGFLESVPYTTLTIPSTASLGICVGAYNSSDNSYANFSGRGPIAGGGYFKPDLVAPGVNITSCAVGGGYSVRSGTSMAAPFVTGGAALLMEYGIIEDNDKYLYGQKLKTYLISEARQLQGELTPSYRTGFGRLCLELYTK